MNDQYYNYKIIINVKNETDFINEYNKGLIKLNLRNIMTQFTYWKELCNIIQNDDQLFKQISEDDILGTFFETFQQLRDNETSKYFAAMYLRKTNGIKPKINDVLKYCINENTSSINNNINKWF